MKLLLSSLLLASHCAISSWSVSSTDMLNVTQTAGVSVREGDTVNITCCISGENQRIRFIWKKNQTEKKNEIINKTQESHHCSNLTFFHVTTKDAGRYICRVIVEIPSHSVVLGNGTVITVMTKEDGGDDTDHDTGDQSTGPNTTPIIMAVAVVVPLLLITLLCFCCLRRRQVQAARVIYEVPHVDSEVAEMDKQSTSSSRGSSQWCQVPVYESFDYFERVQAKKSG